MPYIHYGIPGQYFPSVPLFNCQSINQYPQNPAFLQQIIYNPLNQAAQGKTFHQPMSNRKQNYRAKRSVNKNNKHNVGKRSNGSPDNYQKSCPGCDRYWKFCKCSNIKNRPDPQPYCKFVPPRMLKNKTID